MKKPSPIGMKTATDPWTRNQIVENFPRISFGVAVMRLAEVRVVKKMSTDLVIPRKRSRDMIDFKIHLFVLLPLAPRYICSFRVQ